MRVSSVIYSLEAGLAVASGILPSFGGAMKRLNTIEMPPGVPIAAANVGAWVKDTATKGAAWAANNPGTAACAAVAVSGLAVVAAPAIATTPLLAATGFGSGGPVAGECR